MYGSWAIGTVLYGEIIDKNLLGATFYNAATGMQVESDYFIILSYLCLRHFEIVGVLLLMTVMSAFLGIFLGFHLYITSVNMTTNEFFKWRAVRKFHKKETKRYQNALKSGLIQPCNQKTVEIQAPANQFVSDADVGCTGPVGKEARSKIDETDEIFDPGPVPKNMYK